MQDEFPFDVLDVEDSMDEVLAYYGFHPELDDQERQELKAGLTGLASAAELAEVARMVQQEQERELGWLGQESKDVLLLISKRPRSVTPGQWLSRLPAK